ncbi:MAG TPA: hypothetical protein VMU05_06575 [Dongiaceae bacterium]|nr:hypothetical protein [Dongiaceae bacterium]
MNTIIPSSLINIPPELSVAAKTPRGERAAREFEASLIGSLLEGLEKTFAEVPGAPGIAGSDDYNYLGTRALASGIASQGGFGIAALISRSLTPHEGKH